MRPAATATYRLQLHAGMTLRDARAIVPYLARLGVSHVYASPILQARRASRHGYDVVDPTRLDPKLGSEADLRALVRRLRRHDMGLVLDVVPNHMAIGPENPYWNDVLANGEASRWARWFDVAWTGAGGRRVPLRIPVLGDVRSRVLERSELGLVFEDDRVRLRYFAARFPLDPATLAPILESVARALGVSRATREVDAIAGRLRALPPRDPGATTRAAAASLTLDRLAALARRDLRVRAALERIVAGVRGPALARLLEQQAYQLVHWRRAAGDVNYRRFFAVSELIGLRIEDPAVFEATHACLREWIGAGLVDVVRIDHVDGLADPLGYLEALRAMLDGAAGRDVAVLIEKILAGDEQLRAGWPVAGTTGYEFMAALDAAFVDRRGFAALVAWYERACGRGRTPGFRAVAWAGKRAMAASWLSPDVRRLTELLPDVGGAPPRRALRAAIVELLVCMPVYRTYVDGRRGSPARADRMLILQALAAASRRRRATPAALRHVASLLLRPGPLGVRGPFVRRFQQASGALMAKGVEDTALYRWVPLASRNEVGADPSAPLRTAVARLHAAHAVRARRFPAALSATTTHDTKRSADTRARLHVLAEMPDRWTATVGRWRDRHRPWRRPVDGRRMPDAATEYLVYQTALALWVPGARAHLVRDRVRAYMQKAIREAGVHTSWLDPVPAVEEAVDGFVGAVFASHAFRDDLTALASTIARPAMWTALARTLVHLTAPGVPDLYQGDELWRVLLVDPDNRGDVDFAQRDELLAGLERRPVDAELARLLVARADDGRAKLHVVRSALALRRRAVDVFRGPYVALDRGTGRLEHVVAFARTAGARTALTVVPRLVLSLMRGRPDAPLGAPAWGDTALALPAALARRPWTNVLTGEPVDARGGALRLRDALATFPVALLWSDG